MKKRLKINGIIIFCAFLLLVIFPTIFFRKGKIASLDQAAEIFGIALILLGQILRVSARGFKAENSRNGQMLIQGGPYLLVRNPMYLGLLLIGLGIVLMLFEWWVLFIFLLVFSLRYILLIFKEEKNLKVMFPQDYPVYQQKVPQILPSLTALFNRDISEYLPLKLAWLKKEIGPILAVLLITLFFETWEDIRNKGIVIYFREAIIYLIIIILFIGVVIYLDMRTRRKEKDASNKSKTPF